MEDGKITDQLELQEILQSFPSDLAYAFGYGSGVFAQTDPKLPSHTVNPEAEDLPMIDLILSTSNVEDWHRKNLAINANHYSFLPRVLGPGFTLTIQTFGAGVYFNPMVQIGSRRKRLVKYGVIDHDALKKDLMEWQCMYIAGRMHKPTHSLIDSDEIMMLQQDYNLKYAMATALLLLSENYHSQDGNFDIDIGNVFEVISGLSYIGDPRVAAGAEDPRKVEKLVRSEGQLTRFRDVYRHQLTKLENMGLLTLKKSAIEINLLDIPSRKVMYDNLPPTLKQHTEHLFLHPSMESGYETLHKVKHTSKVLTESLAKIVGPPAKAQSAKGLITAGVYKSIKYAAAKFSKGALKGIL